MNFTAYHPGDEARQQGITINESDKLGSGATATVYKAKYRGKSVAAKIYDNAGQVNASKLAAMLENPPGSIFRQINGRDYPQLAWPQYMLNDSGSAAGYLMPMVNVTQSFSLDHYYDRTLFRRLRSRNEGALSFKLEIARNLTNLVADLHRHGHHFIDVKPQNIRVFRRTHYVVLLDCDGFSISGRSERYPAELISTDYISPEATKMKMCPADMGEPQDCYALAVLLFQLLNGGTHPYQGILKWPRKTANTNDEKAAAGLYPHGIKENALILPRPQSVHRLWDDETRRLFDRAFIRSSSKVRPTAKQWANHFNTLIKNKALTDCAEVPKDVDHIRFRGKDCPACYRAALNGSTQDEGQKRQSKAKKKNKTIKHTDSVGKAKRPSHSSTSSAYRSPQSSSGAEPNLGIDINWAGVFVKIFGLALLALILRACYNGVQGPWIPPTWMWWAG